MFGRATITLGIGPHTSFVLCSRDTNAITNALIAKTAEMIKMHFGMLSRVASGNMY